MSLYQMTRLGIWSFGSGFGMGVARETIVGLRQLTLGEFQPDLTLLLDIPVTDGLERTGRRQDADTRYEMMELSFHEKLRDGFLTIAGEEKERFQVIDALLPVDDVECAVRTAVADRFNLS